MKILIVDDDPLQTRILVDIFKGIKLLCKRR